MQELKRLSHAALCKSCQTYIGMCEKTEEVYGSSVIEGIEFSPEIYQKI